MKLDDVRKLASIDLPRTPEGQRQAYAILRTMGIDPANLYQELEMSGRYVNTHRDTSYGASSVQLHSHAYGELIYCRESPGVEYLVGSNRYRLQQGDIVFVPPGTSHCPLIAEEMNKPYVRDVVWLSTEFLQTVQSLFREAGFVPPQELAPFRTAGTKWEFLGELFDRGVQEEAAGNHGWEAAVIGNTLLIIGYLKRVYSLRSSGTIQAEKPELLDKVAAYIELHYAEHISAQELAQIFYVSSSTISHLFKQKMGVSLYRYITQRRLIAAKSRIEAGEALENVALAVGFSDYSGFYRAFKQEYGIAPRKYRELQSAPCR